MSVIRINGKDYEVVKDEFGTPTIKGMFVGEFLEWLLDNDSVGFNEVMRKGFDVAMAHPEKIDDYADRLEMPDEHRDLMKRFAGHGQG